MSHIDTQCYEYSIKGFILSLVMFATITIADIRTPIIGDTSQPFEDDFVTASPSVQLFKAYAEFKMGNYDLARRMWFSIKGKAHAEALFNIAILYEQGLGVEKNIDMAVDIYEQAARSGSRSASYQLGLFYLHGGLITQDLEKAEHWLSIAALDGDQEAAQLLQQLSGTETDVQFFKVQQLLIEGETERALARLHQLAKEGHVDAITRLAWMFESGVGIKRDLGQAARLFRQAAEMGDAKAQYALAVMLMTGTGQALDQKEARFWLEKAAKKHYKAAQNALKAYSR